ncbi:FAD binding domain-containing protein [Tissierella sp. MSJ-40]|uniref:FAD binding domain-containing protein n=1 Tax=Tissierella simiarum TaxID=2841534 RepID=A0ABS6E206_9FIRM|nr:FAD binding domain-containing protein [Tissierella simiarum]MBU5436935.1 FAD binding domain-containing protein [Tissierella simiarum]
MELQEVYKGENVNEIIRVLSIYKNEAKIIAGGTDIIIDLRNEKISPKVLIDISNTRELSYIKEEGEFIEIGGATTFTQLIENPLIQENLQGLKKACSLVGSPQIRNKGTIGGNIANGSSAADSIPPLICLNSTITLVSTRGKREVYLEDLYTDMNKTIREDELLTNIRFKKPKPEQILTFSKLGLRKALAISRMSISTLLEINKKGVFKAIKIASGSLGKYPMRELEVEEFLLEKSPDEKTIYKAAKILQESMGKRLKGRSTLPYKREAVIGVFREAVEEGVNWSCERNKIKG